VIVLIEGARIGIMALQTRIDGLPSHSTRAKPKVGGKRTFVTRCWEYSAKTAISQSLDKDPVLEGTLLGIKV